MRIPAVGTSSAQAVTSSSSSSSAGPSLPPTATHAIVVFGRGLNPKTGAVTAPLQRRLEAALAQANKDPNALVVVSGGAAHNTFPEALGMRDWLLKRGVPASRILVEDQSKDTIDNAENVANLLRGGNVREVTVVTEQYHVHRAHELLESALAFRGIQAKVDDAPAPDGLSGLKAIERKLEEEKLLVMNRAKQELRHLLEGGSIFG